MLTKKVSLALILRNLSCPFCVIIIKDKERGILA